MADRNLPALRELSEGLSLEEIKREGKSIFGDDEKLSKQVSQYCCRKYSGKKLKEIGTLFGIGESAVNQASRRLVSKITNDEKLCKKIEKIQNKLRMSRV